MSNNPITIDSVNNGIKALQNLITVGNVMDGACLYLSQREDIPTVHRDMLYKLHVEWCEAQKMKVAK